MGYRVVIQPSGHEFHAEPQETLLEAALRSGININYSCSSGSCGDCKARVIEGVSEDRLFHDYRLNEGERANGTILLCTHYPASDLLIEAQEAYGAADIPRQRIATRVARIERLNDAIFTMVLRTPRSQTLRFLAGQHVELLHSAGFAIDLPISSCPCNGMMLQFHLRVGQDEPFASHILAQGSGNAVVEVDGPFGDFVLDDDSPRPIIMVAEDTAFAPIKGLIEHAINLEKTQPLHLLRFARESSGLYMENYCESWRDALDDYRYASRVCANEESLVDAVVDGVRTIPAFARSDLYIALSAPVIDEVEQRLLALGVSGERMVFHQRRREPRSALAQGVG